MDIYEIWGDNIVESSWFQGLDSRLLGAEILEIRGRGKNPPLIDSLVAYDRPDIILLKNKEPILVLEKTREVPTGHNVGQRFARLVRGAEHKITTIFFLPFDARKHGKYTSICNVNTRLLKAMLHLSNMHNAPSIAVNWPSDSHGELVIDGTENLVLIQVLDKILSISTSPHAIPDLSEHQNYMRNEIRIREQKFTGYKTSPSSVTFEETSKFFSKYGSQKVSLRRLSERSMSLIYRMDMSPEKCKRQDPYTGMQFVYDYLYLRNGPKPENRDQNLILYIPRVTKKEWLLKNPEDYSSKSCNWYLIADAIALADGFIEIEKWPLT